MSYPRIIENLIERLTKLPGIGRRSSERIIFWMLNQTQEDMDSLVDAIKKLKGELQFCRICNNLSDREICLVCSDSARDESIVCVVENPKDLLAIERTGAYKGQYHVLLGAISPAEGRGPESLTIEQLLGRIEKNLIREVVIATDADSDGEMTSLYLTQRLIPKGIKVSRIGMGIPMGSSVEYADMSTLGASIQSRRQITG